MRTELTTNEGEFPKRWEHLRLGDVATLQRGFDLPVQDRTPGLFPVIGSNGIVGFHNEAKVPGPGVVIGRSGTIGKSFYTKGAYWPLNTGLYVKDFHDNDPLFIHFFFHIFDFGKYSAGVSVPTLNRNLVHEAVVCIPPLLEQRAIAAVLSKIQAAVEVQDKIVATLKELKAATMAKLFRKGLRGEPLKQTEIGEIPESWEVVRLDALADLVSGGTPSKSRPEWWQGPIPWVSPKDMKQPRLWDTQDHISAEALEDGSRLVPAKTVFVVIRGMILAKDLPVAVTEIPMAFNQDMKAILPRDLVDAEYLLYAISSRKGALVREIGTSAHGTRRMGTSSLEALLLPLPAKEEQREIAAALRSLEQREALASRACDTLKALFSSTLQLLMTGQVRVNNLNIDEVGE